MMQKWEYSIAVLDMSDGTAVYKELALAGAGGLELVAVVADPKSGKHYAYFKRPQQQ